MAVGAAGRPLAGQVRRPDGPRRSRFVAALVLALVLHGIGLLLLQQVAWRPPSPASAPLTVELLSAPQRPALPAPVRLQPLRPVPSVPTVPRTRVDPVLPPPPSREGTAPAPAPAAARAPARAAVRAPQPAAPTALSPRVAVFGRDGRLRVPESVLEGPAAPVASWVDAPRTPAPWDQRIDPLVYAPTALEPLWKPDSESLLHEFIRRSTKTRTFKLPDGTRVTCSWVLLVGGCGW